MNCKIIKEKQTYTNENKSYAVYSRCLLMHQQKMFQNVFNDIEYEIFHVQIFC